MFICDLVKELKTTYTRIFSIYEYVLPYRTFSIPWFYTLSLRLFLRSLPLLSSHSHDLSVRNPFSHGLFPWKNNNNTDRIRDPPSLAYLSLVLVMRRPSLTYHFWISHFRNGTVKRASEGKSASKPGKGRRPRFRMMNSVCSGREKSRLGCFSHHPRWDPFRLGKLGTTTW